MNDLKIPSSLLFTQENPCGDIRVDIVHRVGQKRDKPRSLIVKFTSHRRRDLVNFTDPEENNRSGYYDDGEWKGSTVLSSILEDRKLSDVILIVTRKFGGVFLGKRRFQLIKKAAAEVVNLYTP